MKRFRSHGLQFRVDGPGQFWLREYAAGDEYGLGTARAEMTSSLAGLVPAGRYWLFTASPGRLAVSIESRRLVSSAGLLTPDASVSMTTRRCTRASWLALPAADITEAVRCRTNAKVELVRFTPEIPADGTVLALFRAFAEATFRGIPARSPLAATHFRQVLVHGLLDHQPSSCSGLLLEQSGGAGRQTLRRATAYCEQHADEAISVADIAEAARTSVRALQECFRRELGVTPLGYLRKLRLERAHSDLVAIGRGEAPGNVTDVALRWGFTHLGRFAAEYRKAYRRTPSQTMRAG